MNLETQLEPKLWEAIRISFEARNFAASITDAIHFLSDIIRDKSGLESDGVALIGAAFGGNSPKLKVNRMQSESEQNVQKGVESLLRGVYQAIRNPRSHGKVQDEERDAIAIILFLNYLLRVIDKSQNPFSLPNLVGKIVDDGFVPHPRYAELLVGEIPEKKRLATCREVFTRRSEIVPANARHFYNCILPLLNAEERTELFAVISEELLNAEDETTTIFVIKAFPRETWSQLSELARLRAENKLIRIIEGGQYDSKKKKCFTGAGGTWANNIIGQFSLKDELLDALAEKLESENSHHIDYAMTFFLHRVDKFFDSPSFRLCEVVCAGLASGDTRYRDLVLGWKQVPERKTDNPWVSNFSEALEGFKPIEDAPEIKEEDIPF